MGKRITRTVDTVLTDARIDVPSRSLVGHAVHQITAGGPVIGSFDVSTMPDDLPPKVRAAVETILGHLEAWADDQ